MAAVGHRFSCVCVGVWFLNTVFSKRASPVAPARCGSLLVSELGGWYANENGLHLYLK
ncbi:protein of unknown function [Pararobbsia alpina]